MKRKLILLVTALFALGLASAFAQGTNQKFAHANSDSIVVSLPEFKVKQKELESYGKQLQATLADKEKALQAKVQDYQANIENWLPEIIQEKEKEINNLNSDLQQFQQTARQNLAKKEQEALAPLFEQVQKGIEDVAKEKGYAYVFRSDMFLFADDSDDITNMVIEKLGGTLGN